MYIWRTSESIVLHGLPHTLLDAFERRLVAWVSLRSNNLHLHLRLVKVDGALREGRTEASDASCHKVVRRTQHRARTFLALTFPEEHVLRLSIRGEEHRPEEHLSDERTRHALVQASNAFPSQRFHEAIHDSRVDRFRAALRLQTHLERIKRMPNERHSDSTTRSRCHIAHNIPYHARLLFDCRWRSHRRCYC